MPELPEVETVRRDLETYTLNQAIRSVEVLLERTVAYPSVPEFCEGLVGQHLEGWYRRGKYLLGRLSNGDRLGVHLRMTGQMLWYDKSEPVHKHTRVRLAIANGCELRFDDMRTFGQMWLIPARLGDSDVVTTLGTLGPEPLEAQFTTTYFHKRLQRSTRPIKNALLDQRLVAGIGNIYADESLFLSGIHPQTPCNRLSRGAADKLRQAIVKVLSDSIAMRGTTFSNYRDLEGVNGNYLGRAWVYSRTGDECRQCGTAIERIKMAGRSSHFCPSCQVLKKSWRQR